MATNDKKPDSLKKRTRPDPVSLYPLDFEEALRGILEAGPHEEPLRTENEGHIMEKQPNKDKGGNRPQTPSEGRREDADSAKRQDPGAGGVSKTEYDETIEKAVKDIHG